jgi:UDP-N-acetylmuramoylalanine--D-glutamate ligase
MIAAIPYKDQSIGVFGLGKAGEASVAALAAGGATVFAWDDKLQHASGDQKPYASWPWQELSALVMAPGIALTHDCAQMAKKHGVPIIGDIEILYKSQPEARYIGITGTNGKSTTTTLIGHILQVAGERVEVGGNLGNAALSLAALGKDGTYVLELSSYQLDLVHTTRFNVAVFLNITPDHLDRHGNMAGYIAAKKHIFDRQAKGDVAIIAIDDEYTKAIAGELKEQRLVRVSCREKADIYVKNGILHDGAQNFDIGNIASLTGEHNWQNAALAYATAKAQGIASEKIYAAMQSFPGLRHRLQLVDTIKGVRFINDSKATNADAVQHALKPYQNIYWIAGGKAKSGGIEPLAQLFPHVARAYLIGEAEEMFAGTLEGRTDYKHCGNLENAVKIAAADAFSEGRKDAVVLLSPACASFDQFKSFEHRGDVFCELVEGLKNGP